MPELPPLPPIASQPLSVVLLAHNRARHLEEVLGGWVTFLNGLDRDYEVILVDDGSTDGTGELADKLAAGFRRVRIVRLPTARGEGAALRAGLETARHPLLFYTLCDPHYRPSDLGLLLRKRVDPSKPELELDQVHLMSGSRAGQNAPWPWRYLGLFWRGLSWLVFSHPPERSPGWLGWKRHFARVLARMLFGVRHHDVACPFRLQRREIFAHIPLQSNGSFVHVEILAKINYLGHVTSEEVPLPAGHYPPLSKNQDPGAFRQLVSDARRVICHPDFGAVNGDPSPVPPRDRGARETPAPESSQAR